MKRRLVLSALALAAGGLFPSCAPTSAGPVAGGPVSYDTMIIEPIEVILSPAADPLVAEQLAADYQNALRTVFAKRYRLTGTPGPTTVHLRARLSDGSGAVPRTFTSPRAQLQGSLGPATSAVSAVTFQGEILSPQGRPLARLAGSSLGSSGKIEPSTHWMVPRSLAEADAYELNSKLD
ncbi:DUF3313 family protein [Haloferula sargassicola]|uniref:Lipoprotein n=1 Tax=Haloferula sargassicola TaxID=490096 RepID=A0ABP9UTX1_9BACT